MDGTASTLIPAALAAWHPSGVSSTTRQHCGSSTPRRSAARRKMDGSGLPRRTSSPVHTQATCSSRFGCDASLALRYLAGVDVASAVGTSCLRRSARSRSAPGIVFTSPHLPLSSTSVSASSSSAVSAGPSAAPSLRSFRFSMMILLPSSGLIPRTPSMALRIDFVSRLASCFRSTAPTTSSTSCSVLMSVPSRSRMTWVILTGAHGGMVTYPPAPRDARGCAARDVYADSLRAG